MTCEAVSNKKTPSAGMAMKATTKSGRSLKGCLGWYDIKTEKPIAECHRCPHHIDNVSSGIKKKPATDSSGIAFAPAKETGDMTSLTEMMERADRNSAGIEVEIQASNKDSFLRRMSEVAMRSMGIPKDEIRDILKKYLLSEDDGESKNDGGNEDEE